MSSQVAVMALMNISHQAKFSGILRLMFSRFSLHPTPGLQLMKHMGSGRNGGFSVQPSSTHQGLFCLFENESYATQFLNDSSLLAWYRQHSKEMFTVKLKAYSVKGSWSGSKITTGTEKPLTGPVASLTRASIKPLHAISFWRKAPPAEDDLQQAQGCLLSAGVGEAPILRQATFSIWESEAAMDAYARTGAHLRAIKAAVEGHYFSESMFVRFQPFDAQGSWKGKTLV